MKATVVYIFLCATLMSPLYGWRIFPDKFTLDPFEQHRSIQRRNQENMRDMWQWANRQRSADNGGDDPQYLEETSGNGFAAIVGGVPEEVVELADSIMHPGKYESLGIRPTRGVLFVGPAGTGKTSIARALSQEVQCPFMELAGSDFVELFVGMGAHKVRELFANARKAANSSPYGVSIIFIDEIDAIGTRSPSMQGGDKEYNQTINALLKEMDGLRQDSGVIVIGATNHITNIDKAFLRPGRFDKIIEVPLPDTEKRLAILEHYARGLKTAADVSWEKIAEHTDGLSPADLKELINTVRTFIRRGGTDVATVKDIVAATKQVLLTHHASHDRDVRQQVDALEYACGLRTESNGFHGMAGELDENVLQVIDFLKHSQKYDKLGIQFPKGILMVGPPGTGKTSLARAIAREAGSAFIAVAASEFIQIYVGSGPQNVRQLFDKARKKAQSNVNKQAIIFMDDLDIIGARTQGTNGESEGNRTVGELLNQMDGFNMDENILVIGATNHRSALDPAIDRRFNLVVEVPLPEREKRLAILEFYTQGKPLASDVDLGNMAGIMTRGFSPAKIKDLVNEAAMKAALDNAPLIGREHFEEAWDCIYMGPKTKNKRTKSERRQTAYHEGGHALVALMLPETSVPMYKMTIVARAKSLGATQFAHEYDKADYSKEDLESRIMAALGGRVAEELIFDCLSAGCINDFKQATALARKMVVDYGMSELGTVMYDPRSVDHIYSQETSRAIDIEVKKIVDEMYERTRKLMQKHKSKLKALAEALYEKQTLYAHEVYQLLGITPPIEEDVS